MERRFSCIACGKCCYGWIPLTVTDALRHAGRFPLALIWTPVRQGHKAFAATARIGTVIRLPDRRQIAVRIVPTAYLPPTVPCPELGLDQLCAIHAAKPSRCRTMPFFPYLDESNQVGQLIPRPGWDCDTSERAPVVYRDKSILDRGDFDAERHELLTQAGALRAYADTAITSSPGLLSTLAQAAGRPGGGHVVVGIMTFLPRLADFDGLAFARLQHPVLAAFAEKTAGRPDLKDYHAHYLEWMRGLDRIITRRTSPSG